MTMLKTLAVAFTLSAVILGVNGGTAWGQMTPEKQAIEARCTTAWEVIETSRTSSLSVTKSGQVQVMHCQAGYLASLQRCSGDTRLHRFRCVPDNSK